jgi:hypothetical protein
MGNVHRVPGSAKICYDAFFAIHVPGCLIIRVLPSSGLPYRPSQA